MNKTNPEKENIKTYKGRVKWFSTEKGFGFIGREDGGEDCFVHHTGLEGPIRYLREGELVEFEIQKGTKGFRAVRVRSAGKK
ncbi:MAG: cold-shock protein [Candidatus Omnitrophica bacterium CG11_big_fil_rev_8_21_14_0_20_45_26]|uniref:Cold-shock protein n=1 Tax=Candidatus Abzuiibacterium crystallinum TaxID=1974748 RepID=A0A2H0LNR9_9BACT|nr:MAG: cold-shock protein [Candidatus Omnitrophica bacterium CG11_big_fil_rev_8_21_14_0_20_45_26]